MAAVISDWSWEIFSSALASPSGYRVSKEPVAAQSREKIVAQVGNLDAKKMIFLAPFARGKKGEFKEDIGKLEPIFRSYKLNGRILKLADTVVTKFLEDSVVDDEITEANTKHNFFSHNV